MFLNHNFLLLLITEAFKHVFNMIKIIFFIKSFLHVEVNFWIVFLWLISESSINFFALCFSGWSFKYIFGYHSINIGSWCCFELRANPFVLPSFYWWVIFLCVIGISKFIFCWVIFIYLVPNIIWSVDRCICCWGRLSPNFQKLTFFLWILWILWFYLFFKT